MAYRSPRKSSGKSSGPKFQFSKVVPIWGVSHTNVVNMAFEALMHKLGITDAKSYFHKLRVLIVLSVIVFACVGANYRGLGGFLAGAIAGTIAPLALIWLGILLIGIVIFLAIYVAAWAAILWVAWWLLHS